MKTTNRARHAPGFTLIEIMVVVTIMAALIATGSVMFNVAMKNKAKNATQGTLNAIGAALESMHSVDQLGRYPPTDITKATVGSFKGSSLGQIPNDKNMGAESIFVAFRLPGIAAMPAGIDESIANTDEDKLVSTTGTSLKKDDLFEYVDAYGNPIVYFNASDYKDTSKVEQYVLGDGTGTIVKAPALKNEKTGEFIRPDSYQLYSMGPDGVPGTEDDIIFGVAR